MKNKGKIKLSSVVDVRDGTHDSPKYQSKGKRFITSKNLKNNNFDFTNCKYISTKDYNKFNVRSKVSTGDIIFGMIGTIGNPVIVGEDTDFAIKNVALLKKSEYFDSEFLKQYLESGQGKKNLEKNNDGGIQKFISLTSIRNLEVPDIEYKIQVKLSKFLSSIDQLIEDKESFISELVNLKNSRIKKIYFNLKGQIQRLEKVANFNSGKEPANISFDGNEKKYIGKSDLYSFGHVVDRISANTTFLESKNHYKSLGNEVLLPSSTNTKDGICSPSALLEGDVCIGGDINIINCIDINNVFLSYYFKAIEDKINSITQGSTVYHLYNKHISMLEVTIPSSIEQEKIGILLSSMDNLIELHKQELEELKQMKKYYLNKIFN